MYMHIVATCTWANDSGGPGSGGVGNGNSGSGGSGSGRPGRGGSDGGCCIGSASGDSRDADGDAPRRHQAKATKRQRFASKRVHKAAGAGGGHNEHLDGRKAIRVLVEPDASDVDVDPESQSPLGGLLEDMGLDEEER